MNSEDRGYFDSVRTDSFRNTERDEKEAKSKFSKKTKLPSLSGKLSPFLYSAPKDYAHLALQSPNTGRSMSSNVEASEVRTLNEGLSVDTRKKIPGFTSDTEEWSATNRPEEENKQDFTFHEHTDEGGDTNRIASIAVVEDERLTKTKKKKKTKTGDSEPNEHVESHGNEVIEQKTPKKKKKKKTQTLESLDAAVQKRLSDDMVVHVHKSPEEKPKKKKSKKDGTSKKKTKKQEESKDSKERNGTEKSLEIIVNPLRNLSITSHGTPGHDHKGIVLTESISFIGSPQSTMALNKDMSVKGDDDMRSESCSSPLGPSPFSVKNSKKKKLDTKDKKEKKDKKGKKDKMKMYKLDGNSDEKPKKIKEKKPKHQHHNHHSHKPKRVLLTDGLNLVKILTDRTNCKKTKLIILLYTFTVLWSIVLNGLELAFVASSGCKIYTEAGMIYLCFTIMAILKFLSVTLFNLELTFKQPYKTTSCLLYPLLIQCFSPLLQLPQNIYDFHNCESANRIIPVKTSWEFLQAVIGSIIGMLLYIGIKKRTNIEVVKSRIGSLISKTFKFLVVIAAIGWNLVLIIVFIAQGEIFLPSFFFDFYLYLVLLISTAILYRANRRLGEDGMKAWFIKDEKQLNQPLTQIKVDGQKEKEEKKEYVNNKENHPHVPLDETHQKHTEEEQPEQKEDVEDKETLEKLERIKKKIANIQPLEIKIR